MTQQLKAGLRYHTEERAFHTVSRNPRSGKLGASDKRRGLYHITSSLEITL